MSKIKIDNERLWPVSLGVRESAGKIYAAFASEKEGNAKLHLYNKETNEETVVDFPEENRIGNVRTLIFSGVRADRYDYSISVNGEFQADPYARLSTGRSEWGTVPSREALLRYSIPKMDFDWKGTACPHIPMEDTIIYRLHVRGFSMDPASGVRRKGTFAGIIEKIPYLKSLGVTMVELQCVSDFFEYPPEEKKETGHSGRPANIPAESAQKIVLPERSENETKALQQAIEKTGADKKKINYWGYGPSRLFAPKAAYAWGTESADIQLKRLIRTLHENGMEISVELYFGPETGAGFCLEVLRTWVMDYHVDAFRLSGHYPAPAVTADPFLAGTKIFADHMYDCRPGKNHAAVRSDYMTDMRKVLKGDEEMMKALNYHMKDSGEDYGRINALTGTNGFTLADLVTYDVKHNEANGENGADGTDYNYSWNCGVEGPTTKKKIQKLRRQQIRNAWVMLMTSQGTPMILAGDEYGNSQGGNNNAYGQDNETGWVNWKKSKANNDLRQFAKDMIAFRKSHSLLHKAGGLHGNDYKGTGYPDFSVHGEAPWRPQYENFRRQLGFLYNGRYAGEGEEEEDIYICYNMHWEPHTFSLPVTKGKWCIRVNTAADDAGFYEDPEISKDQKKVVLEPRSIVILTAKKVKEEKSEEKAEEK